MKVYWVKGKVAAAMEITKVVQYVTLNHLRYTGKIENRLK